MINPLEGLDKSFDHRVRLGIMSVLMVNEWVTFTYLRDLLEVTDGRLASHVKALEEKGYLKVKKQFVGRRPSTSYMATSSGRDAFDKHLKALQKLVDAGRGKGE